MTFSSQHLNSLLNGSAGRCLAPQQSMILSYYIVRRQGADLTCGLRRAHLDRSAGLNQRPRFLLAVQISKLAFATCCSPRCAELRDVENAENFCADLIRNNLIPAGICALHGGMEPEISLVVWTTEPVPSRRGQTIFSTLVRLFILLHSGLLDHQTQLAPQLPASVVRVDQLRTPGAPFALKKKEQKYSVQKR